MFIKDLIVGLNFTAVMGVLSHVVGEALPRNRFNGKEFPFKSAKWECQGLIYNKLHISKWMRSLPDMSKIIPYMFRKKLDGQSEPENVLKFIQETCVAETIHVCLILVSPILTMLVDGATGVCFMLLYAICNLPFIFIQRYNRPKLVRLYERQLMRKNIQKKEIGHCESFNIVL